MRKLLLLLLCLLCFSEIAEAQYRRTRVRRAYNVRMQRIGEFSLLGSAGISTYFGDLKQSMSLWAKPSVGGGVQYRISRNFSLRGELLWYRISGADTLNDVEHSIHPRNLSFQADNFEGNVTLVGYYFNKYKRSQRPILNPYAFMGLGFTTNTPKAHYNDEWHNLRPLKTEGVSYSSILLTIPFGIGLTYHDIFPQLDLSLEVGYRYTFSDYIDDASTNYRDKATFTDPIALALSDRREEFLINRGISKDDVLNHAYEGPYRFQFSDKYRGNPSNNDWYLISAIKVVYTPGAPTQNKYRRYKRAKF
jgi:hypothetical protein